MKAYKINNCYSAQIECAGLNFRYKYTCMGIAPPASFWHRSVKDLPWWYRLFFPISLGINYHTGQADQWMYFEFTIGPLTIWCQNQGERPKGLKYEQAGLHMVWHWNRMILFF